MQTIQITETHPKTGCLKNNQLPPTTKTTICSSLQEKSKEQNVRVQR